MSEAPIVNPQQAFVYELAMTCWRTASAVALTKDVPEKCDRRGKSLSRYQSAVWSGALR
jgi:hypothetical protein